MQTDFSPLKKSLPARSHEFLPRKCATLVFLALERVEFFSQDLLSRAASRFSRGAVARHHRQHLFDQTGSNTTKIGDQIEKMNKVCRVRTEPYSRYFPGYYTYRNFCKFCTTFIPVPGASASSVRPWHNTQGMCMPLQKYPVAGTGTGTAFVYLPGTSVSSVRRPYL